jgi:hypothetical protein
MERKNFFSWWFSITENPVLYKELSIGLRDRKIFTLQTIYLTILAVALYLIMAEAMSNNFPGGLSEVGKIIFYALFWIQLVLVVLIAPSLTCGAVSTEKEKKTYELLIGTLLTPGEIISGKLLHGVSYIFLLLISSLPITAAVFFLGGVSPGQIIGGYLIIFASGLICCQIGEFFSVREPKTANATNQSYLIVIFVVIGLLPSLGAIYSSYHGSFQNVIVYKTFSCPLWLFITVNFIAAAGFLFHKTVNYISHRAKNIVYLNLFFILGYFFNLLIVSAIIAEKKPGMDDAGLYFTFMIIGTLLSLGFFGRDTTFPSTKEYTIYRRSLLSHPYFFPAFFSVMCAIPVALLSIEMLRETPILMTTLFMHCFYIFTFFITARILSRFFQEKLPLAFLFYFLFIVANFAPYISFSKNGPRGPESHLLDFHFLSPAIVTSSLWVQNNFPKFITFLTIRIPLHLFSVGVYLFVLLALAFLWTAASNRKQ